VLALALLPTEFTASQFQRRASHRVAAEIALANKTAATVEASETATAAECRVVILDRRFKLHSAMRVAAIVP